MPISNIILKPKIYIKENSQFTKKHLEKYTFLKLSKTNYDFQITNKSSNEFLIKASKQIIQTSDLDSFFSKVERIRKENQKNSQEIKEYHQQNKKKSKEVQTKNKKHHLIKENILKDIDEFSSLSEFFEKISKRKEFKPYRSFLCLQLNKGHTQSLVIDLKNNANATQYHISAKEFNDIYSSIKKSKSNFFYGHPIVSKKLGLIGFFQSKVFNLKGSSFILVLSKDGLVEPSLEEQIIFSSFSNNIEKVLAFIERKKISKQTIEIQKEVLSKLEYQFSISKNKKKLISNTENLFQNKKQVEGFTINYDIPKPTGRADIFHVQRINLLGELFNILKHELSNPLFGIKMSLEVLGLEEIAESEKDIILQIQEATNRSLSILDSMTQTFASDSKIIEIEISTLIEKITTICKSELKNVFFEINYQNEDLKKTNIKTDITAVTQIIFNLIINAIEELKKSWPEPRQRYLTLEITKENDTIGFIISDNGKGIEKHIKDQIFNLFYSTKKKGNGIGLALSCSLAKKLGGNLSLLVSKPASTKFCLELPINSFLRI